MATVDYANYAEQIKRRVDKWLSEESNEGNRKIAKLLNEANKSDNVKSDKTKVKEIEKQINTYKEALNIAKDLRADIAPFEAKLSDLYSQLERVSYVSIPHRPKNEQ
jgi:hypothetical protein